MNRTLKFRAWIDGKYIYWTIHQDSPHWNINTIIEQYTNLKDKNGVEIYEGDIVNCVPLKEWSKKEYSAMFGIREVFYNKVAASFQYASHIPMDWGGIKYFEVIGNIHENPELI